MSINVFPIKTKKKKKAALKKRGFLHSVKSVRALAFILVMNNNTKHCLEPWPLF